MYKGRGTNFDKIIQLCKAGEEMTSASVAQMTGKCLKTTRTVLLRLKREGVVKSVRTEGQAVVYKCVGEDALNRYLDALARHKRAVARRRNWKALEPNANDYLEMDAIEDFPPEKPLRRTHVLCSSVQTPKKVDDLQTVFLSICNPTSSSTFSMGVKL